MEDLGFFIGFLVGIGILIAICKAVHTDSLRRNGDSGTATMWVVGIVFLPIVFLPLYFVFRALAPNDRR
jgi:hypothetical protein